MNLYKQIEELTNPRWLRDMKKREQVLKKITTPYFPCFYSLPIYTEQDVQEIINEPKETEVDPEWEYFMNQFLKSSYR